MAGLILRLLVVALGLWLAAELVPGIEVKGTATLLGAALLLGLVNAVARPLLILLTLPFTILTLGLFLLVINAATLALVAWAFDDFTIAGFWPAVFGALVVSVTGWLGAYFLGPRGGVAGSGRPPVAARPGPSSDRRITAPAPPAARARRSRAAARSRHSRAPRVANCNTHRRRNNTARRPPRWSCNTAAAAA